MTGPGLGASAASRSLSVTGVPGMPEISAGDDLAGLIADAAPDLADGDIVVITSKIVSKAEDRVIRADRDKAIDAETVRVVARRGASRIVETQHGLVLAAAGVDDSNTPRARWRCCPRTRTSRRAASAAGCASGGTPTSPW